MRASPLPSMETLTAFQFNHTIDYNAPGMAPFDTYILNAVAFVIDRTTNEPVPIIQFATDEGPDNFAVSSNNYSTISAYDYSPGIPPTPVSSKVIQITVKRSHLARAFTMCLLLVNIALTLGSSYVTLVIFFKRDEDVHDGVLLLPVTIILTIPALRNLFVGSPPFGIYLGRSLAPKP